MKFFNETRVEGYLYEHNLEMKESGPASKNPGTPYITGTISIATDNALTNVIQVHYSYVVETTAQGKPNATFTTLRKILDGEYGTIMSDGIEKAVKIRAESAIGLNEFYAERNGKEELVSVRRNEGGFVHVMNNEPLNEKENQRSFFKTTMLITKVSHVDADEEKNTPEKAIVSGCIFDFRKALLPMSFTLLNTDGISYFEGLEASQKNPVLMNVWGKQVSTTVVNTITEESSWGDAEVREFRNTYKDFIITGGSKEPFVFDMEDTMTADELTKAIADRETYLATVKKRREDYLASKNGGTKVSASNSEATFNF